MQLFTGALLAASASAAIGKATLELTVANDSGAGFNGHLKVRRSILRSILFTLKI